MASAFTKEVARGIRGSLGRFLAIMGISALGCGFFAGLKMSGPDMRAAADAFYDGTKLYDVRVVSTMGLADADMGRLAAFEGVTETMPSISFDAMARLGERQVAVRVSSLAVDAAKNSTAEGPNDVVYAGEGYLNRVLLREGSWPQAADECVIDADKNKEQLKVGDHVELLYGVTDLDDLVSKRSFTVVGLVSSPSYPYTGSFGSTTLGSGMIEEYLYCPSGSFAKDAPFTEAYLRVDSADNLLSESDEYLGVVQRVAGSIEQRKQQLAAARLADVKGDAQAELDDARKEFEEKRDEAYAELDDAKRKLDDAERELVDGQQQIDDGQAELDEGTQTLASKRAEAEQKLQDAQNTIDDNQKKLDASAAELQSGRKDLDEARATYDAGVSELLQSVEAASLDEVPSAVASAKAQLSDGIAKIDAGIAQIESAPDDARAGIATAEEGIAQADAAIKQASDGIAQAQAAIDQAQAGKAEAEAGKAQAEEGLAQALAAQDQLPALKAQLQTLVDQHAQLEAAIAAATGEQKAELERQLAQLEEGMGTLEASIAEIEAAPEKARAAIDQAQAGIDAAEAGIAQATAAKAQAEDGLAQAQAGKEQAEAGKAQAEEGLAQALAAQEQLPSLRAQKSQLQGMFAQLDEASAAAAKLLEARGQIAAAQATIDDGAKKLAEGQAQLNEGRAELARQREDAYNQLAEGQAQLDDAAAQLADARAKLADGRAEYQSGQADYQKAKADAERELADAQGEIDDAQKEIDDLEPPDIYVLDRTKNEGAATYHADTERMDSLSDVFPLMFFLVAALVSLTTMTRMVEDDRIQIGTYKALGYSTARIASKYLIYAGLASATGAVVGIVVLSQVLPYVIISSYSIIYTVPIHPFPLPIDLPIALLSGLVGVGVTLLATWAAVVSSLREVPATLMLPRAPAAGKRIFLERIGPLWRRLSFSWKVTCRNLFRYKRRLTMTIIGISGCTALLLVGFGLHDSIWDIIDCQYGPIVHYNATVGMDDEATAADVDAVERLISSRGYAENLVRVQHENMQAGSSTTDATLRVSVVVPQNTESLSKAVTLRERLSKAPIVFDENAVVVTEKIATKYGLAPGDEILLFDQDAIGNTLGEGHALRVTGVAENYVGNLVYLGRNAWATIDKGELPYQTIYAHVADDNAVRDQLSGLQETVDNVSTVSFSEETINLYRNMLSVVDAVVVVLIVSAGALAAIVLYNLTNINIAERVREIASLKVLGFTKREVYAYIFREIALLAVLGDILGLAVGSWLENFVVVTAEVDYVMFGRAIHLSSYVYSFAITLAFTALILMMMRVKLDRVNMVESLKSVD